MTGNYDEIIIMSDLYMFEILKEILELGIPTKKIELGVNLPPATGEEVQYILAEEKMTVRDDGVILWNGMKEIYCHEDIELLKKLHVGSSQEIIRNRSSIWNCPLFAMNSLPEIWRKSIHFIGHCADCA